MLNFKEIEKKLGFDGNILASRNTLYIEGYFQKSISSKY